MKFLRFISFIFYSLNSFSLTLSVQNTSGTCGEKGIPVYINIDNASGLLAFQFDLYYDSSKILSIEAKTTSMTSNFMLVYNNLSGYIKVAAASAIPVSNGSGPICYINFDVISTTEGTSPLELKNALINDVPPSILNGVFTISNCSSLDCAKNPEPPDGATNIPLNIIISWRPSSGATSYDIYFGNSPNPPFFSSTEYTSYSIKDLNPKTKYYWKIIPKNQDTAASGCPIWNFTTKENDTGYSYFYIVPAGAHSPGGYGSFWKTDLSICNFSSNTGNINIALLKMGEDNSNPQNFDYSTPSNSCTGFLDIIYENFSFVGAGALKISSSFPLEILSRTYNDSPTGTYGQFIPSIEKNNLLKKNQKRILSFLQKNEYFRTNIGCSSLSENIVDIKLKLYKKDGTYIGEKEINLQPYGYLQINDIFSSFQINDVSFAFSEIISESENAHYTCYASVVDNKSNDPIFIP